MVKISVSILTNDDLDTILKLNKTDVDYIHIDVMDGKFVSDVKFPLSKINEIGEYSSKKLDVHLMVKNADYYIDNLDYPNIEYLTVHYEALRDISSVIKKIKNKGIKCGLSVKPNTDIKDIFDLLGDIDLVLIMSVEPGFGGQEFLFSSTRKVKELKSEIEKRNLNTIISIDGGINNTNSKWCIEAGCDMLVSGSYIINSNDYQSAIDSLR
jgi:ribulose-phosphate 3-epimerase